jgi:hypothetical protein
MQELAMSTRWKLLAIALALGLLHGDGGRAEPGSADSYRLTGPAVHGNLAIYFVHGQSRSGSVPLTLQEALAQKVIEVRETGRVNELEVKNIGAEEIFIQAGDIVKGGQQDRVLSVSLVLPPHAGAVSIPSFCVESGRWSARSGEDVGTFSSGDAALPSREAKIEMAGSALGSSDGLRSGTVGRGQQEIWKSVAQIQGKLSTNLGVPVAAPKSRTSLQLTLENTRLGREVADYVGALQSLGEQDDDIVGYVFAVNGKLNSADIYPSNGLFRKMWPKLLRASATEAIGDRATTSEPPPSTAIATAFINSANSGSGVEARPGKEVRIRMQDNAKTLFLESRPAAAPSAKNWMHRSYLAK